MKGSVLKKKSEKIGFRKVLITFQFVISIFLIVISIFITLEIKFLMNKDIGMNKENLLLCRFETKTARGNFEQLRSSILSHPEILNASMSTKIPMYEIGGWELNWEDGGPEEKVNFRFNYASYDFIENMGLEIIEGRDFSRQFPADVGTACIINETGRKTLGWNEPLGKWIGRRNLHVVGVVKDFHIKNIFDKIEPYILVLHSGELRGAWTYAFRIAPGKLNKAKSILKDEMALTFPDDAFEFHLFDQDFKDQETFASLYSINNTLFFFTVISILLTIIGLFGLVLFTIQRQTKEIGIRKINGALPINIFSHTYKEYFKLIIIAAFISWPLSYYIIATMPGTYKITQELWIYALSLGIELLVSFLAMLYYTIKAANRNPVESLRYE